MGIEVWLYVQVGKWLMFSLYSASMPVEVLPPLNTSLINGKQFSVSNMVPSFSGCEILTI